MQLLPKELQTTIARKIIRKLGTSTMRIPIIDKFIQNNPDLILNSII